MSARQPDWDLDKLTGEEGEALVRSMRTAILAGTCEVKTDMAALSTGRVYVEYRCRTANGWQPSGLATTKAASWAFVIGRTVVWMPVWVLKNIAREYPDRECTQGSHPTKGKVIPLDKLVLESLKPFRPNELKP